MPKNPAPVGVLITLSGVFIFVLPYIFMWGRAILAGLDYHASTQWYVNTTLEGLVNFFAICLVVIGVFTTLAEASDQ